MPSGEFSISRNIETSTPFSSLVTFLTDLRRMISGGKAFTQSFASAGGPDRSCSFQVTTIH
jgi:hypothetical protein